MEKAKKFPIVLVGMGDFEDYGGWSLDTQFVTTMGVPYLLAHGMGKPVKDAQTTVYFPETGKYFIKVYTYNWVSPWKKDLAPGIFQIMVNDKLIETQFGKQGERWGWHNGGEIDIQEKKTILRLHDLTGFEGRCGLILFSKNPDFTPPTGVKELTDFYKEMTDNKEYVVEEKFDLVVSGGGIAGICAALSAARRGLKTALIQDRPVVGGNNSSEIRVWLGGETNFDPFPGIGNIVGELEQKKKAHYGSDNVGSLYEDEKKQKILENQENLKLYLNHIMVGVKMKQENIQAVEVFDIKQNCYKLFSAELYVDSTGDGTLGYMAGADYEVTTNGHMGMTNYWHIKDMGSPQSFPECPWAIDLKHVDFPGRIGVKDIYDIQGEKSLGCWFWESGCEIDPIEGAEYARDTNFRAMYGAWDCLKNFDHSYENYVLGFSSYIGGKRESRRFFGDVVLTKSEVKQGKKYEDGCVPSTWNFDVHYPDKRFYAAFYEGDGFLTRDYHETFEKPYFIPYRCLYSRNIKNLFMAGRNVSVSHDALGTVRVMRTGGMMGEVIGVAAELCKKYKVGPREIYTQFLDEFMAELKAIPRKTVSPRD